MKCIDSSNKSIIEDAQLQQYVALCPTDEEENK